ncbi:MAG TPA: ABC transporter permease [Candidatus Acidoferrum sp.]|nr:ABC transporter permease [Candidatus Acidoferrum sp.]
MITSLQQLFRRLRAFFRRAQLDRDLDAEISSHLQFAIEENLDRGLSPAEARRQALLRLGGPQQAKENQRDARGLPFLDTLFQDLRFAFRMLRKSPGFTAVAVLTLALGIGANISIFSVVYAVLLKALPYPQPDRLAMVYENVNLPSYQNSRNEVTPGNFSDWTNQNAVFENLAAYRNRSFNLTGSGEPLRIEGELVSANFFTTLQIVPELGRGFAPEEDLPGASHVVVMSNGLWKGRFGSDPQILGQKLLLDGESYAIIGVAPPGFHFPDPDDQLWAPLALSPAERDNRGSHYLEVFARLKPGVTLQQAQTKMSVIAKRLTQLYPQSNAGQTVNLVPLEEDLAGPVRPTLFVLWGAVGLVLLIVCANVANLLLARASARHREIAVRLALGASRLRLFRQLLTESTLLALFGCVLGLLLARWGVGALKILAASRLPRTDEFSINSLVLIFSVGIAIFAGLFAGLAPALQTDRRNVHDTLKAGARESAAGSRLRIRNLLVIAETALGVIVVIGAGLLLRSFLRIEQAPLGFQPQGVLSFRAIPRGQKYSTVSQRAAFYRQALERIDALPGANSAAAVTFIPLTFARGSKGFTIEGRPPIAPGQIPMAGYDVVTPGYFATMGIPLREGRDFSWNDTPETQLVILINEAMAKTYWPNEDPLGKRIRQGNSDDPWLTVAGVVGDIREFDPLTPPRPTIYFPITQFPDSGGILRDWVVRTAREPLEVAASVRSAIWSVDKDLAVTRVRTMEEVRSLSIASQRLNLLLFTLFAAMALVLATVGTYGVMAYSVAQRTREIGIRVALGATRADVFRTVLAQGFRLAALGLLVGIAAALALTRLMTSMIYGISSTDAATFITVALLLAFVALAACYIPARRAMRVDPMVALRYE